MIIRKLSDLQNTPRQIIGETFVSNRLILKEDNMGFSFHITTHKKGDLLHLHYKNHLESVYCIKGNGKITDVINNKTYNIDPGSIYILDKNDKHIFEALTDMELACVFNPPLTGNEIHDKDGSDVVIIFRTVDFVYLTINNENYVQESKKQLFT
jgi:L-ectoine synthase